MYSETIEGCHLDSDSRIGTYRDSDSTISLDNDTAEKKEGHESMQGEINVGLSGWIGWFVQWGKEWESYLNENTVIDMSAYANGCMKFWVKTPINLKIGIRSSNISPGDEFSKVYLSNYCSIDNEWHEVSIPIETFKSKEFRLDLTKIKILFNVAREGSTDGIIKKFWIDKVRWSHDPMIEAPALIITGIIPNTAANTGIVRMNITGNNLQKGAIVKLHKRGENDITETSANIVGLNTITTVFDLLGIVEGLWDVIVINPDGYTCALTNSFSIVLGTDTTSPGTITDIKIKDVKDTSITLEWTAPGDDGYVGKSTSL